MVFLWNLPRILHLYLFICTLHKRFEPFHRAAAQEEVGISGVVRCPYSPQVKIPALLKLSAVYEFSQPLFWLCLVQNMTRSGGLCQIVTGREGEKVYGLLLCFSQTHLHAHTPEGASPPNDLAVKLHYEVSQLWSGHFAWKVALGVHYIILWVICWTRACVAFITTE